MEQEGIYLYGIIETHRHRTFGPIGIGGREDEVFTIDGDDLGVVASRHPITPTLRNIQNMLTHERVLEGIMKEYDSVLPICFGTIAPTVEKVRTLLETRQHEFRHLLKIMNHKVELGVKGIWKNRERIFKDLVREHKELNSLKRNLLKASGQKDRGSAIEAGKRVEQALIEKKEKEAEAVVQQLRGSAVEYKLNPPILEEMFLNASFLVDQGRIKEFDNLMADLSDQYIERYDFWYAGPLPAFNFVRTVIYSEEWEK